jgi:hypothetical protein
MLKTRLCGDLVCKDRLKLSDRHAYAFFLRLDRSEFHQNVLGKKCRSVVL